MPPVTANNVTITKTPRGMTHAPAGNPVNVPEGGTVKICNRRKRAVRVTVTLDGDITYTALIPVNECITLKMGSNELPNGHYDVIDPPDLLRIVGRTGGSFSFKKK
jgi:hypothetical protein